MLGTQPRNPKEQRVKRNRYVYSYQDKQECAKVKQQTQLTSHSQTF